MAAALLRPLFSSSHRWGLLAEGVSMGRVDRYVDVEQCRCRWQPGEVARLRGVTLASRSALTLWPSWIRQEAVQKEQWMLSVCVLASKLQSAK
jgi:hypothetical protein